MKKLKDVKQYSSYALRLGMMPFMQHASTYFMMFVTSQLFDTKCRL